MQKYVNTQISQALRKEGWREGAAYFESSVGEIEINFSKLLLHMTGSVLYFTNASSTVIST